MNRLISHSLTLLAGLGAGYLLFSTLPTTVLVYKEKQHYNYIKHVRQRANTSESVNDDKLTVQEKLLDNNLEEKIDAGLTKNDNTYEQLQLDMLSYCIKEDNEDYWKNRGRLTLVDSYQWMRRNEIFNNWDEFFGDLSQAPSDQKDDFRSIISQIIVQLSPKRTKDDLRKVYNVLLDRWGDLYDVNKNLEETIIRENGEVVRLDCRDIAEARNDQLYDSIFDALEKEIDLTFLEKNNLSTNLEFFINK